MSYKSSLNNKTTSHPIFRYSLDNFYKNSNLSSKRSNVDIPHTNRTQIKIKVSKSTDGIKNIIDKYSSLKSSNQNLNYISEAELKNLESKDEETNKLNEYLEDLITRNEELKYLNELEFKKRNELESEQKSIAEYCNNLKKKFKNYHKTIADYTQNIQFLTEENLNLQENYDKKIEEFNLEIKKKQSSVEDRLKIVERQQDQIIEKDNRYLNILKEIDEEKNKFAEKQMLNKIRYQELEKKYADLQKQIYEMEINDDIRRVEMKGSQVKNTQNNSQIGDIYLKINNYVNENKSLENNIKDLSIQLNDIVSRESQKDFKNY